jgi:hypothetical protein
MMGFNIRKAGQFPLPSQASQNRVERTERKEPMVVLVAVVKDKRPKT